MLRVQAPFTGDTEVNKCALESTHIEKQAPQAIVFA